MSKSTKGNLWKIFKHVCKFGTNSISLLISIISLVFGIISMNANEILEWKFLIGLVIFNSIFLIGVSIYGCVMYFISYNLEKMKKEAEKKLEENNECLKIIKLNDKAFLTDLVDIQVKFNKECIEINEVYTSAENFITTEDIKNFANDDNAYNDKVRELFIKKLNANISEFKQSVINRFNGFIGYSIHGLKNIIDKSLSANNLKCSITLKQMNDGFYEDSIDNSKKIQIITCYRDSNAFTNRKEVGRKIFKVNANTAFSNCLHNDSFLKNHLVENDDSYLNETSDFLKYYNCVMVVPIYSIRNDMKCYYGYLACDVLYEGKNTDIEIFNAEMVEKMKLVSTIIASYYDEHFRRWEKNMVKLNLLLKNININHKELSSICSQTNFLYMIFNEKKSFSKSKNRRVNKKHVK